MNKYVIKLGLMKKWMVEADCCFWGNYFGKIKAKDKAKAKNGSTKVGFYI